jgi:hypothetical protein
LARPAAARAADAAPAAAALQAFEQDMGRRGGQDLRWLQQARRSGTTQDKVAAMSVLVQVGARFSFLSPCNLKTSVMGAPGQE